MGLGNHIAQEWYLRAPEVSHLNLCNVYNLCAQVPPCLLVEGQSEEGWQGQELNQEVEGEDEVTINDME